MMHAWLTEFWMLRRQGSILAILLATLLISTLSVGMGMLEVRHQERLIATMQEMDAREREQVVARQTSWGNAAYYTFHATWSQPSALAFAALGERDHLPWKHRIRMLAIEGQIYEDDAANPELELAGRLDFSFVIAILAPLLLITLLHDLHAIERRAGRRELLIVSSGSKKDPWFHRSQLRLMLFMLALLLPFWMAAILQSVPIMLVLEVSLLAMVYLVFWAVLVNWIASRIAEASTIAALLVGAWLLTAVVLPPTLQTVIAGVVPVPAGSDILQQQREKVNDAWDLPKATTMDAFVAEHPEWRNHVDVALPFEWKWYYAFQQVGDQSVATLAKQRRKALMTRHELAGYLAWLSPPWLIQQRFSRLAKTDTRAAMQYEIQVRAFHAELRRFFYPLLFGEGEFDLQLFDDLPTFNPAITSVDLALDEG